MTNMRNHGIVEGRLSQEIAVFDNKDGSKKLKIKMAVRKNYKNKEGKYDVDFVSLDAFISKEKVAKSGLGVYASIHEGDSIACEFEVQMNNYKDKDGKDVYDQVLMIQQVDLKESKAVTEARAAQKAAAVAAGAPVAGATAAAEPAAEEKPFGDK